MIKDNLDKGNNQSSSTSYIELTCAENANPQSNWLMLHTEPYTFIKLQPGKNILTVEEYPALKYGFSQIPDCTDIKLQELDLDLPDACDNGLDIIEVDFSHFDASEMTTMKEMFYWMRNIKKFTFGKLNTSSLINTHDSFRWVGDEKEPLSLLDLSGLDFSKVKDIGGMFNGLITKKLNLKNSNFSNAKCTFDWFADSEITELILDNVILTERIFSTYDLICDASTISLKGWTKNNIKTFIELYENDRAENKDLRKKETIYKLDTGIDYKLYENDEKEIECTIIEKFGVHPNQYQINGTVLQRFNESKSKYIVVPYGIKTIADYAFENAVNLEIIILPETIEKIGHYAFAGCQNLKCINIPSSVTYIGDRAFRSCKSLKSLYLPDNVTTCGILIENIDCLRIPVKVLNQWAGVMDSICIRHLIVGLPKNTKDPYLGLDDYLLNDVWGLKLPRITFETYECSHFSDNQIFSIDGVLIYNGDIDRDYLNENEFEPWCACALKIANDTLAVPTGIELLDSHCVSHTRIYPLYIPESVDYIAPDAFEMWGGMPGHFFSPILVTKKSNYKHLKEILPPNMSKVRIYLI